MSSHRNININQCQSLKYQTEQKRRTADRRSWYPVKPSIRYRITDQADQNRSDAEAEELVGYPGSASKLLRSPASPIQHSRRPHSPFSPSSTGCAAHYC